MTSTPLPPVSVVASATLTGEAYQPVEHVVELHVIELVGRGGQRIAVEDDQVGQLAWSNRSLPVLATGDEGAAEGVGA